MNTKTHKPDYRQSDVTLLAIVSVTPDKRIYCQHPNCNKTVYAKIHVLRVDGAFFPVGETCYKKYYSDLDSPQKDTAAPTVFSSLTDEQRALLESNTAEFVEKYQCEVIQKRVSTKNEQKTASAESSYKSLSQPSKWHQDIEAKVKSKFLKQYKVNPDDPRYAKWFETELAFTIALVLKS